MKKTIYNLFSLISLAAVLFSGTACEEANPVEDNTLNFPELVTLTDIEPGTELTLTIQPNKAWSVSISKESYSWFKIKDGKFDKQTLSGVSQSEPMTITIWTTSEESFALRSCEVVMTMADQTKTIAKYTLRAKDRVVEAYRAAVSEDGKFTYNEDGYSYESEAMGADDVIELIWDENDKKFFAPVKVNANFDWTVEFPEWARADINVESKTGEVCFEIYGISSRLSLDEDLTGELTFKNASEVMKRYKLRLPKCNDKFSYNLGGYRSLTFDHAAYLHTETGSATLDPIQGILFGPAESKIVVLELTDAGYVLADDSWLVVELDAWDNVDGADVLQTRYFSISSPRYSEASDRKAIILFLPATAPEDINEILATDKMQVRSEYASYAVSVVQNGRPDEYFTFEVGESELVSAGLLFERSEEPILPDKNFTYAVGTEEWQYNLSYIKEMATTKSPFYITEPFESTAIYDAEGNEVTENLSEHWLSYNALGEGLYGQIVMDMTKFTAGAPSEIDGYIVFKDVDGKVLASVHCFYKEEVKTEEDVLVDVSSEMFVDHAAAEAAGAKVYELVSGPTYEIHKEHQAPIYVVRYTADDTSLEIKTSRQCWMYSCPGKMNGPELVTIDDQIFHDYEYDKMVEDYESGKSDVRPDFDTYYKGTEGILTFGATSFETRSYPGKSKFNMKKPEGSNETEFSEVLQFGSSSSVLFVFICELILK